jgi:hypothetical protein
MNNEYTEEAVEAPYSKNKEMCSENNNLKYHDISTAMDVQTIQCMSLGLTAMHQY